MPGNAGHLHREIALHQPLHGLGHLIDRAGNSNHQHRQQQHRDQQPRANRADQKQACLLIDPRALGRGGVGTLVVDVYQLQDAVFHRVEAFERTALEQRLGSRAIAFRKGCQLVALRGVGIPIRLQLSEVGLLLGGGSQLLVIAQHPLDRGAGIARQLFAARLHGRIVRGKFLALLDAILRDEGMDIAKRLRSGQPMAAHLQRKRVDLANLLDREEAHPRHNSKQHGKGRQKLGGYINRHFPDGPQEKAD